MKFVESERTFLRHASQAAGQPRERFSADDLRIFRERHDHFPEAHFVKAGWYTNGKDVDAEGWGRLESLAGMEARIALLRTGITLERYRILMGSSPGDLRQLVPDCLSAVPTDPFDDQPLRYRVEADGSPHLWSIGMDLVDEGGLPHLQRGANADLVWITRLIPGVTKKELRR